jgi:hypothetical protein
MSLLFALEVDLGTPQPPKRAPSTAHLADVVLRTRYGAVRSLSTLLYSHNRFVKLLPVSEGILLFGHRVPQSIYGYGSPVLHVPLLKTVHNLLQTMGQHRSNALEKAYLETIQIIKNLLDNVQHYKSVHNPRIWR